MERALPFPLCVLYCWCLLSSMTFKVTFCLLLSGVLKGDKSHTKKTTPQQKITNPPFKHKQTNPTTHKQQQKPPNKFKTLCSPSLQLLYCLFSFKEEKNPQNIICVCRLEETYFSQNRIWSRCLNIILQGK